MRQRIGILWVIKDLKVLIRFQFILGVLLLCSFGWSEGLGFKLTPEATKALRKLNLPGINLNLNS